MNAYTGERLLLTLWVGSLWAIGYLAVPMAFVTLQTSIAGDYAGKLFHAVNLLGLACAVVLLLSRVFVLGVKQLYRHWRSWVLLTMLVLTALFLFYLQPEMQQIKEFAWQTDPLLTQRFDLFHKLSENVYLGLSLLGLLLVLTSDKHADTNKVG